MEYQDYRYIGNLAYKKNWLFGAFPSKPPPIAINLVTMKLKQSITDGLVLIFGKKIGHCICHSNRPRAILVLNS